MNISTSPVYDYDLLAATGKVDGVSIWNKFGYNADIDTGSAEVIASFGGV